MFCRSINKELTQCMFYINLHSTFYILHSTFYILKMERNNTESPDLITKVNTEINKLYKILKQKQKKPQSSSSTPNYVNQIKSWMNRSSTNADESFSPMANMFSLIKSQKHDEAQKQNLNVITTLNQIKTCISTQNYMTATNFINSLEHLESATNFVSSLNHFLLSPEELIKFHAILVEIAYIWKHEIDLLISAESNITTSSKSYLDKDVNELYSNITAHRDAPTCDIYTDHDDNPSYSPHHIHRKKILIQNNNDIGDTDNNMKKSKNKSLFDFYFINEVHYENNILETVKPSSSSAIGNVKCQYSFFQKQYTMNLFEF